jgi:hypothetical protein
MNQLARTLLQLARYEKQAIRFAWCREFSQDTLAEMVGTTRSRIDRGPARLRHDVEGFRPK